MSLTARILVPRLAITLLAVLLPLEAQDRQDASSPLPPLSLKDADPESGTVRRDERYRIGAGDVLDVRVFERPQLSRDAVRVDGNGAIRMPLIDADIPAACRTEAELAKAVADHYREFLVSPHVDVFVTKFSSQPVAVTGAVLKPGSFQLERRVRLRELITFAAEPAESAGQYLQIIRDQNAPLCPSDEYLGGQDMPEIIVGGQAVDVKAIPKGIISIDLAAMMRGDRGANRYVRPGDLIHLPQANHVYIVGNVHNPTTLSLTEPLTVSRAIAKAGGVKADGRRAKIRIIRRAPGGSTNVEIVVNLKAIEKSEAQDPLLQADDIVHVPMSFGKHFLSEVMLSAARMSAWVPLVIIR